MTNKMTYFDQVSVQEEIEMYVDAFEKAKNHIVELEIKRVFYLYLDNRNAQEMQFVRDYLSLHDGGAYDELKRVLIGRDNDKGVAHQAYRIPDAPGREEFDRPVTNPLNIGRSSGVIATIPVPQNMKGKIPDIIEVLKTVAKDINAQIAQQQNEQPGDGQDFDDNSGWTQME